MGGGKIAEVFPVIENFPQGDYPQSDRGHTIPDIHLKLSENPLQHALRVVR